MNIFKSKSNNKTPKNSFNFESIKNSFWLHVAYSTAFKSYSHILQKVIE